MWTKYNLRQCTLNKLFQRFVSCVFHSIRLMIFRYWSPDTLQEKRRQPSNSRLVQGQDDHSGAYCDHKIANLQLFIKMKRKKKNHVTNNGASSSLIDVGSSSRGAGSQR